MAKYGVSKEIQFDAGHRVPDHGSKCRNPHGHRYRVVAYFTDELIEVGSSKGMVRDFGDIKNVMMSEIHDKLDHGFMVYDKDTALLKAFSGFMTQWKIILLPFVPTAENLARWCFMQLDKLGLPLDSIEIWETPTSAAYFPVT